MKLENYRNKKSCFVGQNKNSYVVRKVLKRILLLLLLYCSRNEVLNQMKVYELIQQLAEFPADMELATSVIGECIMPLNWRINGAEVDIDSFNQHGIINAIQSKCDDKNICVIQVEIE